MPIRLTVPFTEEQARALRVGDEVLLSGRVMTAREAALRRLLARDEPRIRSLARGAVVYHCAPVARRDATSRAWSFVAAGPAPSMRQEPWQGEVLARYGLRGVLGTGGMGPRTLAALERCGAVYLHAARGLAVVLAQRVTRVLGAHLVYELGLAAAVWFAELEDFPAVVTMDAHGRSLHAASATGSALDPVA